MLRRALGLALVIVVLPVALSARPKASRTRSARPRGTANAQPKPASLPSVAPDGCPSDMVAAGSACVDRFEASLVDAHSGEPLSPFYPADPASVRRVHAVWQRERSQLGDEGARAMLLPALSEWQRTHDFSARAVSQRGALPSGYLTYHTAKLACENAGKRLCTKDEWERACRGASDLPYPYGGNYVVGACNVHRATHPAHVLHADASLGHLDPRLNLVLEDDGEPLLRTTGATASCVSRWRDDGVYDMVGNLDEWIDDAGGTFVGGFYARATTKGCAATITTHAPGYSDYSTGTRCCRDPR